MYLEGCRLDMGMGLDAHGGRSSGVAVEGKACYMKECHFVGGGGSAVTVRNSYKRHPRRVELFSNTFVDSGQPSFCSNEIQLEYGRLHKSRPSEVDFLDPGPAAIELLSELSRPYIVKRRERRTGKSSRKLTAVVMRSNVITHNMRAPISGRRLQRLESWKDRKSRTPVSCRLVPAVGGDDLPGFRLTLDSNKVEHNGFGVR